MGAINCSKHDRQTDCPLCCEHVSFAVHSNHASIKYECLYMDFMDDGSLLIDVLICQSCIEWYDIDINAMLSGETCEKQSEQGAFPVITPICPECMTNYKLVEHSLGLIKNQKDV